MATDFFCQNNICSHKHPFFCHCGMYIFFSLHVKIFPTFPAKTLKEAVCVQVNICIRERVKKLERNYCSYETIKISHYTLLHITAMSSWEREKNIRSIFPVNDFIHFNLFNQKNCSLSSLHPFRVSFKKYMWKVCFPCFCFIYFFKIWLANIYKMTWYDFLLNVGTHLK